MRGVKESFPQELVFFQENLRGEKVWELRKDTGYGKKKREVFYPARWAYDEDQVDAKDIVVIFPMEVWQ